MCAKIAGRPTITVMCLGGVVLRPSRAPRAVDPLLGGYAASRELEPIVRARVDPRASRGEPFQDATLAGEPFDDRRGDGRQVNTVSDAAPTSAGDAAQTRPPR